MTPRSSCALAALAIVGCAARQPPRAATAVTSAPAPPGKLGPCAPPVERPAIRFHGAALAALCDDVYVEPAITPAEQRYLRQSYDNAIRRNFDFYGPLRAANPMTVFCKTDSCRASFAEQSLNERPLIVVPRFDATIENALTRAFALVELRARAAVPEWFAQGLAAWLADEPDCNQRTRDGDISATCQARREVADWLEGGKPKFWTLLEALQNGKPFSEAYGPIAAGAIDEEVLSIPVHTTDGDFELETTIYRPSTPPPWPLVVFNHGANGRLKSFHLQSRERPTELARFFVARGYLVAAPMREGFSRSTGEVRFHCNMAEYALTYARDIRATIEHFVKAGQALPSQVVVAGQSNGGMVALGYAADSPTAAGVINISGGIDTPDPTCDWRFRMIDAAASLGAATRIPALWLYAKDDDTLPPYISQPFFDAYRRAGVKATLKIYGSGGHGFSYRNGSAATWGPEVERFLTEIGLPSRLTGRTR